MTEIHSESASYGPVINAIGDQGFRVGDNYYNDGIILTPTHAIEWSCSSVDMLMLSGDGTDGLEKTIGATIKEMAIKPEFLLLGTGAWLIRPVPAFVRLLEEMDIGVEVMDSRAAARAWSVLRIEERHIIAAIMKL